MTHIQDIIDDYHAALTDEIAEATDDLMRQRLRERGLYFGLRPLCIVLRPHFYFEADWQFLKQGLETLLTAFQRTHEVCVANADYRERLFLEPYEEELHKLDAGGPVPWTSSRLDTFYLVEERSLKVVEYNAETPAGIGYGDELSFAFNELGPVKRMQKHFHMNAMPSQHSLHYALLEAYKIWGGTEEPQIAILDWRDVPTLNEHEITRQFFEANGTQAILADPHELDYRAGHLWKGDFRIDIIYKRVLYNELVELLGTDNAVINAIRDHAVCITNSPSAKLMAKKASLAFLSDVENHHLFTAAQLGAIEAHIPWTRVVEERKTRYQGKEVDLIDFVSVNKERFVIKPNDEYGGKGVTLGWECSDDGWTAALHQAMESPFVVQEKVKTVQRDFPSWVNGQLNISPRYVDADPYVFNGQSVSGCLTRLSPLALLNVTAGGGSVVPTYVLNKRD